MDSTDGPLDLIAARAEAAWSRGDRHRAMTLARLGLGQDDGHPRLLAVLGAFEQAEGRSAAAAGLFRRALARCGDDPLMLHNLGVALRGAGLIDAAATAWEGVLRGCPQRFATLFNLARLRDDQGRGEEALALYRRACLADPTASDATYNLGNLLARRGALAQAAEVLGKAARVTPHDARIQTNLGIVLRRLGDPDGALACQRRAVALDPDLADAQWNLANLLLALDDYDEGFTRYEWRKRRASWRLVDPPLAEWRGEDPAGRRLLVGIEQGAGDMIQAARFLPVLAGRGARVIVEAPDALAGLLVTVEGVESVVAPGDWAAARAACHIRAFSLPHRLGLRFADLAATAGPYLRVPAHTPTPPALPPAGQGLCVGLCWSGNPDFTENAVRAAPLAAFAPVTAVEGLTFFSLQKGPAVAELAANGLPVIDLDPWLVDYAATAAVMARLDMVVTTDTSVAHLAGALGRPCLLLLAAHCDWRWGIGRETSPWYPSLRLLRQERLGDWRAPVARAAALLAGLRRGTDARGPEST
ncbi:hypothetical protein CKO38_01370 [Rhodospirillum rubrum]|uniref:tetratricopeptide repeat protein n=1 Tax=Rhodospirillum rubrum TaxID=1085 RepID=UPI0019060F51|nr:tetratricopeptide repeat protein [Rhodospirillum rubrum]MBK1664235.1 hypothetical protein [Rhodospirillum rubrum]MBK1675347.1 hypothetical protein [Rhodospirillum rubrum]